MGNLFWSHQYYLLTGILLCVNTTTTAATNNTHLYFKLNYEIRYMQVWHQNLVSEKLAAITVTVSKSIYQAK